MPAERALRDRAHRLARRAIKTGDLVRQPCEGCGALTVDAHHEDHSRPLDVMWLCRTCHLGLHGEQRRCANAGEAFDMAAFLAAKKTAADHFAAVMKERGGEVCPQTMNGCPAARCRECPMVTRHDLRPDIFGERPREGAAA